jgi:hypothetical protein
MIVLWTREQCRAWSVFRRLGMVDLVAPQDEDNGIITVEQLLRAQKKARRRRYTSCARKRTDRHPEVDTWSARHGEPLRVGYDRVILKGYVFPPEKPTDRVSDEDRRGDEARELREWVLSDEAERLTYEQGKAKSWRAIPAAHEIPPVVGSIAEFEGAVADGRLAETEDHMFVADTVMSVLPALAEPAEPAPMAPPIAAAHEIAPGLPPEKPDTARLLENPAEPRLVEDAFVPQKSKRGRKPGQNEINDEPHLLEMRDLLADGEALSVNAAAKKVASHAAGQSESSTVTRLRGKFSAKYGANPQLGKTSEDARQSVAGNMQRK